MEWHIRIGKYPLCSFALDMQRSGNGERVYCGGYESEAEAIAASERLQFRFRHVRVVKGRCPKEKALRRLK